MTAAAWHDSRQSKGASFHRKAPRAETPDFIGGAGGGCSLTLSGQHESGPQSQLPIPDCLIRGVVSHAGADKRGSEGVTRIAEYNFA
jgi:hypothetical protein